VLDLESDQNAPVYADPQLIGCSPSWAPAGSLFASWDGINGGIHVIDLQSGEETLLPTESGEIGGWSPDGAHIAFSLRYSASSPARSIWIVRPDYLGGPTIGNNTDYTWFYANFLNDS